MLCDDCMENKQPGTRLLLAKSPIGQPAEYERVVRGIAKVPNPKDRYVQVNGVKHPLPPDHFDCDNCGAEIKPGDKAGTWTVWTEGRPIREWEHEYLEIT